MTAMSSGTAAPRASATRRLLRSRRTTVASPILLGIIVVCFIGAWPAVKRSDVTSLSNARMPPGAQAWFGTDLLGRSLAARCILGGAISLAVGIAAAIFSVGLGVVWGSVAAMAGGRVDAIMMRIVDVLFGLPYILLVILLKIGLEGLLRLRLGLGHHATDLVILMLAIGGVSWLTMARVIRARMLTLLAAPFIEAARAIGVSPIGVWRRHLLPNLLDTIIVYAALTVPQAILQESFLSFLGIGVAPPLPSWGNLAADGVAAVNTIESFWWMLVFPCGLLSLTLLCMNALGEGLRDALDPRGDRRA
ncbi:MAG: ABC transporter permease [Phycisphaerae bacterium]|nr:ABC transporter permease [Phycisphaerae bacterium]